MAAENASNHSLRIHSILLLKGIDEF